MIVKFGSAIQPRNIPEKESGKVALAFFAQEGIPAAPVVFVDQVHGKAVHEIQAVPGISWSVAGAGDALLTSLAGVVLVIRTGDCVPVVVYDSKKYIVGIAHAGWRGILAGVIGELVGKMAQDYTCSLADIKAYVGPAICGQHYDVTTVSDDRAHQFEEHFGPDAEVVIRVAQRVALDLPRACWLDCQKAGILAENIVSSKQCTFEDEHLPSHRREGEARRNDIWTYACMVQ